MQFGGDETPFSFLHIGQVLNDIRVDRIDHGNRALEDEKLVARLAKANMALTVCPLSNLRLCVVRDLGGGQEVLGRLGGGDAVAPHVDGVQAALFDLRDALHHRVDQLVEERHGLLHVERVQPGEAGAA